MKKLIFFASLIFFGYGWSYAQTVCDSDQQILNKIKEENTKYSSLSSEFKQTKRSSIFGEDICSKGSLYYKKPEKMSMHYTEPQGDLMIIDEQKFIMAVGGKHNETNAKSNARMRGIKNILTSCMEGNFANIGANKITCKETPQYYIVTAEINRKANKSNITKVIANYDKQDHSLTILQMEEPDSSFTVYELINKKTNHPINDEVFQARK